MRTAIAGLVLALAVACGDPGDDYRVTTDLGPAIRALASDDLDESSGAADRILAAGAAAVPALRAALGREPADIRSEVVAVAARIDDPAAVGLLVDAARDPDAGVRYAALTGLGARAAPEARDTAEAALADTDARARLAAVAACAALCASPAAMTRLVELGVRDEPLPNAIAARSTIVRILADAGRADRVRAAIRSYVGPVLARREAGDATLRAALLASDVGDPGGHEALERAARDERVAPALRLQAIHALGTVGDADSVAVLSAVDGPAAFADYACDAIRRLATRGIEPAHEALASRRGTCPAAALPPPPGAR